MKDDTIYVVSSFHRSGSAMMMRCLEAGGLRPVVDTKIDELNDERLINPDYIPNPNGFYQTDFYDFKQNKDTAKYQNSLIKVYIENIAEMPQGKYKMVFMKRNPEEIKKSMRAFRAGGTWYEMEALLDIYDQRIEQLNTEIAKRGDIEIMYINYADVVNNPTQEFQKLVDFGFPVDVNLCASMVEPSLRRFNLENI